MFRTSFYIGKIAGIPIRIHISWLVIFLLITWTLTHVYAQEYPGWNKALYFIIGVITSFLFFISVLIHELAHSIVAKKQGVPVKDIVLFIFGGVSELSEEPRSPGNEFVMALVGPLSSFLLFLFSGLIWFFVRSKIEPIGAMAGFLAIINLMLFAFNLIPGFPLDGGRVFRAILWAIRGDIVKATRWASIVGQGFAFLLIFLGIWWILKGNLIDGIWIILIGWFLDNAAMSSYRQVNIKQSLAGHTVKEVMTKDCPSLSPDITIEEAVEQHIIGAGRRCLPVVQYEKLLGLLTIHSIKKIPKEQWSFTKASQAMIPLENIKSVHPDEDLWKALQAMTEDGFNQLVVLEDHEFAGMLARDHVVSFIRNRQDLGLS